MKYSIASMEAFGPSVLPSPRTRDERTTDRAASSPPPPGGAPAEASRKMPRRCCAPAIDRGGGTTSDTTGGSLKCSRQSSCSCSYITCYHHPDLGLPHPLHKTPVARRLQHLLGISGPRADALAALHPGQGPCTSLSSVSNIP